MSRIRAAGMLGYALILSACSGTIGDTSQGGGASGRNLGSTGCTGTTTAPGAPGCSSFYPGPSPLRRLTRWEYNHTVHDLLGDNTAPATRFPPQAVQVRFDNHA